MSGGTQPTSEENVDSDDPVPSAPPLYPLLPANTPTGEPVDDELTPINTPTSSPMMLRSRSDFNMQRVRTCVCVHVVYIEGM